MHDRRRGFLVCGAAYTAALAVALASGALLTGRASPLVVAGVADVVATGVVFAFSRAFDNSSLYDPYWSVAPPCLLAFFAWTGDGANAPRLIAATLVVVVWAVRLTHDWARRWEGLAHEDFRYVDLRAKHGRRYWLVIFFAITALFVFVSVPLMDARMLARRPGYAEHMKATNAIVPRFEVTSR